jgi:hypothetical protein
MAHPLTITHAIAVDIREVTTGAFLGVALVVPSERYFSFLDEGAEINVARDLSAETWQEIDAWTTEAGAHLPAKPEPMRASIVAAFLGGEQVLKVTAHRFAAIPITVASRNELSATVDGLLPGLLKARRSGT